MKVSSALPAMNYGSGFSVHICGAEGGTALSEEEALENWNMRANVRSRGGICPFCDGMNINLQHQGAQFWYECAPCGAKAGVGNDEKEAQENWNIRR
ncbi:MAG: hypothetical protein IJ587_08920 [Synergistaceae bacterium]|nr:hypothetical protein [Synergistaceae bacterium]